jgi:hypothetical protein
VFPSNIVIFIYCNSCFLDYRYWYSVMGLLSWFYVEAKALKLSVEEGRSVLLIFERSREVSQAAYKGKVSVAWLLAIVETLVQGDG